MAGSTFAASHRAGLPLASCRLWLPLRWPHACACPCCRSRPLGLQSAELLVLRLLPRAQARFAAVHLICLPAGNRQGGGGAAGAGGAGKPRRRSPTPSSPLHVLEDLLHLVAADALEDAVQRRRQVHPQCQVLRGSPTAGHARPTSANLSGQAQTRQPCLPPSGSCLQRRQGARLQRRRPDPACSGWRAAGRRGAAGWPSVRGSAS